jgi:voltage-gated potassium channel
MPTDADSHAAAAAADAEAEAALAAGSATDGDEASVLNNPGYEVFIGILSILSIVNLVLIYVVKDDAIRYVLGAMNLLLSIVLFIDFLYRLRKAPSKSRYFFRQFGWADLGASLPLPQLKILRVFRLIKVWNLVRRYGLKHLAHTLVKDRAGSALWLLLLIAIFVLEFGSVWMLRIEQYAQGANITTASDSIWYVIVTIATVGYGDQFPVTNAGRLVGSGIIILGVAIFGTLSGYLANAFIAPRKNADAEEEAEEDLVDSATRERDEALHGRVEELHALLAEQQQAIARLEALLREK